MKKESFVLKGNICQTKSPASLDLTPSGYAVCVEGKSKGVFSALPEEYQHLPLYPDARCLLCYLVPLPFDDRGLVHVEGGCR